MLWLAVLAVFFFLLAPVASAVNIEWVTVGDPGNACDTQPTVFLPGGCFGGVANEFLISKYETTNGQYTEFLNAVAITDTNGLYNSNLAFVEVAGGITRSGSPGNFSYSVIAGRENKPVAHVSFWNASRFANWLHNGQPNGAQDNTTTEDGAYTLTPAGISANSIVRNSGPAIVLPSEDEWYKAAYYDAVSSSFFDYPAGSDTETTCAAPSATANTANCNSLDVTDVGSYTGALSPSGTFDQGGNVFEWNEAIILNPVLGFSFRGLRGGSFAELPPTAPFSEEDALGAALRLAEDPVRVQGFRVATVVPEPRTGLLLMSGLMGVASLQRSRAGSRGSRVGSR